MRRVLLLLCLMLLVAVGTADAKTAHHKVVNRTEVPVPQTVIIPMESLPKWVQDDATRKLRSRHRKAVVNSMLYVGDFPDTGDVVRLTPEAINAARRFTGRHTMPIGSSSLRQYDPLKFAMIMSEFYNATLGPPRANMLAGETAGEANELEEPYNGTVLGFRPGVILVDYKIPKTRKDLPVTNIREIHHYHHDSTTVMAVLPKFWLRPSVGGAGAWLNPQRVLTPTGYVVGGTRFGRHAVGIYAGGGEDLQPSNCGTASAGVQFGDEPGASVRVGYRSTWNEFRGDGHTSQRSEGFEAGIGYGFPAVRLGLTFSMQYYSDLDNSAGDYYPAVNLNVDLGPIFLWK